MLACAELPMLKTLAPAAADAVLMKERRLDSVGDDFSLEDEFMKKGGLKVGKKDKDSDYDR